MKSEFGQGFIYNLFLFTKHYERREGEDNYWIWFNGAGDHFFDLEIPKQFKNKNWAKRLKRLQNKVLKYRYINNGSEKDTREKVFDELEKIILLIDKDLGVNSLKATCN